MFFKNKHVITSLIVAPILAIISYFAVDYYVAEVPHKAKEGQLYNMLAKPNCRWESGQCHLIHRDLELTFTADTQAYGRNHFFLESTAPLKGIVFAVAEQKGGQSTPTAMASIGTDKTMWKSIEIDVKQSDYLQFAISINGSIFQAEVPAVFTYKEELY